MRLRLLITMLSCWGFLVVGISPAQTPQEMGHGSLLCQDQVAITITQHGDLWKGVSSMSLASQPKWQAIPDEIVDVRPTVAGASVAVIGHGFHTIYGFSKATGELQWQKETGSRILESDGKLFYVLTEDERTLQALDPASGNVVWSLRLPYQASRFYSYHVHGGRLYSGSVVVDLSKKAIVHTWVEEPILNALAFGEHGEILTGDEFGVVRIYNSAFKPLGRIETRGKDIDQLAAAGGDLLVSSVDRRPRVNRATFTVLTQQGKKRWQLTWQLDYPAYAISFVVVDRAVVLMEPDRAANKDWLVSRKLSTGRVNWKTDTAFIESPQALCGNTAYVYDSARVRVFDLRSGEENTVRK